MTVIRGDITKIYEIERDAYTQPIAGVGGAVAYTFAGNVDGLGDAYFTIAYPSYAVRPLLLHRLQITCQDTVTVQRSYIEIYPDAITIFDSYFFFTNTSKEFSLGDSKVDMTLSGGQSIRLHLVNYAAPAGVGGQRYFEGALWIIA